MLDKINRYNCKIANYIYAQKTILLLLLIYTVSISCISSFHEVWRDETRALSIAMESNSVSELFYNLHNEGHPALWHLILYFGYKLINKTVVLKIMHILIAVSAIYVFLLKSPFRLWQKILFIFGYYPIYVYSIINRNYSISMLLLFLFCSLYKERFKKLILVSLILFLLANTNAHSLIIVMAIFLSLLFELCCFRTGSGKKEFRNYKIVIGFIIIILGLVFSILQLYPDETTLVVNLHQLNIIKIGIAMIWALAIPSIYFYSLFGVNNPFFITILLNLYYLYLLRKPFLFIIFFLSIIGLIMFFNLIYYKGGIHHQGIIYLLIITSFWIDNLENSRINERALPFNKVAMLIGKNKNVVFVLLLIIQVCVAYPSIITEINAEFSSSKSFANFLSQHLELREAIIIGEPDFFMEAIPYYTNNLIYIPREKRFGKITKFTNANKKKLTLEELLNTANNLKNKLNRPIIIALGHNLSVEGPYEIQFSSYKKFFIYSKKQLKRFLTRTTKKGSFQDSITKENYDVFLLN